MTEVAAQTSTVQTTTATQGTTPGASQPGAGDSAPWFSGFDADTRGYIENKGWVDPNAMVKSYQNLEQLVGRDKIVMPRGLDDAEGWGAVWDKLGRPKTAGEYGLPVPEGSDGAFAGEASEIMHKLGLTTTQARQLAEWWNGKGAAVTQAEDAKYLNESRAGLESLQRDWGQDFDAKMAAAQSATQLLGQELGFDKAKMAKLERALGTTEMMGMLNLIGERIAEDRHLGDDGGTRFLSPEGARARLQELSNDSEFQKRYLNGDTAAVAEMQKLQRVMAGGR